MSPGYIAIWQNVPHLPGCLKEKSLKRLLIFPLHGCLDRTLNSALFETPYFLVHDLYFPKLGRWQALPMSQSRFSYFFLLPLCTFSFETAVFRPYPNHSPNQLFQKHPTHQINLVTAQSLVSIREIKQKNVNFSADPEPSRPAVVWTPLHLFRRSTATVPPTRYRPFGQTADFS